MAGIVSVIVTRTGTNGLSSLSKRGIATLDPLHFGTPKNAADAAGWLLLTGLFMTILAIVFRPKRGLLAGGVEFFSIAFNLLQAQSQMRAWPTWMWPSKPDRPKSGAMLGNYCATSERTA
jgi:hypothetical protein